MTAATSALVADLVESLDPQDRARVARALAPAVAELLAAEDREPAQDRWLDSRAAAAYLDISLNALHRLSADRRIPCSQGRPGGRLYFLRSDLDDWRSSSAR